ncbi:hypothetical protein AAF712_010096 [Marasmius tenuissimus]|uniref:Heterokaryon incompatibility domain-containing protein n=1 Tax=Marasmius tenuissimus TaxID=585030 RepID=A0ABR2ZNT0_9AGAR
MSESGSPGTVTRNPEVVVPPPETTTTSTIQSDVVSTGSFGRTDNTVASRTGIRQTEDNHRLMTDDQASKFYVDPRLQKSDRCAAVFSGQYLQTGKYGSNFPLAVYNPEGEQINEEAPTSPRELPTITTQAGTIIFREPIADLQTAVSPYIDLTPFITPERYRFIDCSRLVNENVLQIWETLELPRGQYAAISHVWKSLSPRELDKKLTTRGDILVDCEERNDGGPISVDVLRHTCMASLEANISLLWLDRLCIAQMPTTEGKRDKRWQIMHMYDVYKDCAICFVLPAGLRRYPAKFEETEWVERAWTFQEVMVAPAVKVLYTELVGSPPEIVVHSMHIEEYFKAQLGLYDDDRDGSQERRRQFAQALDKRQQYREPTAIHLARFRDVWESVQWRISARPVDVVFSVMGLLDVTIYPAHFTKNDRLKATVALAQALLLKDDSPNTCIEVPLWRCFSRSGLDSAREMGMTTQRYIANTPARVRLDDLDRELDTQSISRFKSVSRRDLTPGFQAEGDEVEDGEMEDLDRADAVVMGGGQKDVAIRRFMARKLDLSVKARRKADHALKLIPHDYLRKVLDSLNGDDQRVVFETPDHLSMELCRRLFASSNLDEDIRSTGTIKEVIFGWCVQSVLWVRLGKFSGSDNVVNKARSVPVPIITFWKFCVTSE